MAVQFTVPESFVIPRSSMPPKKSTPLPAAIIPFILQNLDGFNVTLEDGERIVITPKVGAQVSPQSRGALADALLHQSEEPVAQHPVGPGRTTAPILRPKFIYRVLDKKLNPEQAKRFGFSEQRYTVYRTIFESKGIQAKDIMEKTGLPHGTVQQILHWLRNRKLITGEPETN